MASRHTVFMFSAISATLLATSAMVGTAWASPTLHQAVEIMPPANAAADPQASLSAVECLGTGSCVAGGGYTDNTGQQRAMVVTETAGHWARARELTVPGATPSTIAFVFSLDCVGASFCVAVGEFTLSKFSTEGFVVTRSNGTWGKARPVSPPAGGEASLGDTVNAVACTAVGSCVLVGNYSDARGIEMMAATMSGGRWRPAFLIQPPLDSRASRTTQLNSVACPRTGSCAAVGNYVDKTGAFQPLGVTESGSRWGRAFRIVAPVGYDTKAAGGAGFDSVACTMLGSCVAAGSFATTAHQESMTASEVRGIWQRARASSLLPAGADPSFGFGLKAVACKSAGNCLFAGLYMDKAGNFPTFVNIQSGGGTTAHELIPPPNSRDPSSFVIGANAVDCASTGYCVVVGSYNDRSSNGNALAAAT